MKLSNFLPQTDKAAHAGVCMFVFIVLMPMLGLCLAALSVVLLALWKEYEDGKLDDAEIAAGRSATHDVSRADFAWGVGPTWMVAAWLYAWYPVPLAPLWMK